MCGGANNFEFPILEGLLSLINKQPGSGEESGCGVLYGKGRLQAEVLEGARCRGLGERLARLELLKGYFDGLVELLVDACIFLYGVVVDVYVGVYAVVLDYPFAGAGIIVGEEWHTHVGTVDIWQ